MFKSLSKGTWRRILLLCTIQRQRRYSTSRRSVGTHMRKIGAYNPTEKTCTICGSKFLGGSTAKYCLEHKFKHTKPVYQKKTLVKKKALKVAHYNQKEYRKKLVAQGLCRNGDNNKTQGTHTNCQKCLAQKREHKNKLRNTGFCINGDGNTAHENLRQCQNCLDKQMAKRKK